MKEVVLLVIGAVFGALAGLTLTVKYEDRWKARELRRKRLRRSLAIRKSAIDTDGPVCIAGYTTNFYLVEGDGEVVLEPAHLSISVRSSSVTLPILIEEQRKRVAAQLRSK